MSGVNTEVRSVKEPSSNDVSTCTVSVEKENTNYLNLDYKTISIFKRNMCETVDEG